MNKEMEQLLKRAIKRIKKLIEENEKLREENEMLKDTIYQQDKLIELDCRIIKMLTEGVKK